MAIFTTQKPTLLFTTVDGKGNKVDSSGTFSITKNIDDKETVILNGTFENGQGFTDQLLEKITFIYIFPNGCVGSLAKEIGSNVRIFSAVASIKRRKASLTSYLGKKYPPRDVEFPPKDKF